MGSNEKYNQQQLDETNLAELEPGHYRCVKCGYTIFVSTRKIVYYGIPMHCKEKMRGPTKDEIQQSIKKRKV